MQFHHLSPSEVLTELNTNAQNGLTAEEAGQADDDADGRS